MRTFNEQLESDLYDVFLNLDQFGEKHVVEGNEVQVVIDDNQLTTRQGGAELNIAESDLLLFAKATDLPQKKSPGSALNIDGREFIVDDWREDKGLATVTLRQNRTI